MSLSIYNSTTTPLLGFEIFEGQVYDNILDFAEINISINCDVGYTIYYIYSQDKINIDYIDTQVITASALTTFIKKSVYDRYFKLRVEATDGDMSFLNIQTIYKSNISYNENSGIGQDVNVTNPSLSVNVSNFPTTQPISGSISVTNSYIDTHITQQTVGLALDTTLQSINQGQKTVGFSKVWDNSNVLLNGVSSVVTANSEYGASFVSIFGNCDTTTTLIIQLSNDNLTFYSTQYSYSINTIGDFGFALQIPFKYLRLINKGQNINSIITYINHK